jgi:phenylalanyl-tRNA synthetase beta chain
VKILLSWLHEFVAVQDSADALARTMSTRGFAVESIEPHGEDDAVIDFEVTANRPDCMSVIGMAREVATAYGLQVRRPAAGAEKLGLRSLKAVEKSDIDVIIENPDLCPRYVGAVADVTAGPSPDWMQVRLQAVGIRPISNIVDVTNYVLIEMGHPMHAFDLAKLAGPEIRVRTARPDETLRTLDGQTRQLAPDMLVIADAERATAVAGVMGGADSEVTGKTTAIVLESAYFKPLSVRRTSKKLGLKTEASLRFERGADPRLPVTATERAAALIEMIGAGRARGTLVDRYPKRIEPSVLRLRRARISGLLGGTIADADVRKILEGLGFALRDASDPSTPLGAGPSTALGGWDITVPTRRVDVTREVDLIEEIARHYGFDRLPTTFPALTSAPPPADPRIVRARHLRDVLTAAGFFEAVTFGFIGEAAAASFAAAEDLVPIANPLSDLFAVLRPSLVPGLVDAVAHNMRREQRDVRLFEIGAQFTRSRGERQALACIWSGAGAPEHWSGTGRPVDFFDMKAVAERTCDALGVGIHTTPALEPWLVPGRSAAIMASGTRVGIIGQLAAGVSDAHGLPGSDPVYVAEIDLDALDPAAVRRDVGVEPLPRYPSVTRDISILIDEALASAEIRRTIREAAPATLVLIREFDRYEGKGIPPAKVSLSLRLTFRSSDRTLTDAEVQEAMDGIIAALKDRHGAVQR